MALFLLAITFRRRGVPFSAGTPCYSPLLSTKAGSGGWCHNRPVLIPVCGSDPASWVEWVSTFY